MNTFLASLVLSVGLLAAPVTTDRPSLEVRINGQPLYLTIDTGSTHFIVFSYAADRIGLRYHKPRQAIDPNRVRPGRIPLFLSYACRLQIEDSENCPLRLDGVKGLRRVRIAEIAPGFASALDGLVGWPNLSKSILHLDWGKRVLETLPEVPDRALQWRSFRRYRPPGIDVLALQATESGNSRQAIYIDTGDPGGVRVSSALWREIISQHPGLPTAIDGYYTPAAGCVLTTICWVKDLKLGAIELQDVPVSEAPKALQQWPSYLATIGLYGLTRLELVVDGKHNRAYIRTKPDYSKAYDYNRSGGTFLPVDNRSSDLVATVLEPGPAYEAGIRDGDKLLRVNGRDITGWRTDPSITEGPSAFQKPAGTKLNLTVLREGQPRDVTVTLRELLPVEASPAFHQENKN